jgi:hypothetical protein
MRKIETSDLVGKTIRSIEHNSVNVLKLTFTDGTTLELWAEDAVYTPYGNIAGFYVEDHTDERARTD